MPDLTKKTTIRKGVMIPCFAFMAFIIVLGIFKNDWLKTICKSAFRFPSLILAGHISLSLWQAWSALLL